MNLLSHSRIFTSAKTCPTVLSAAHPLRLLWAAAGFTSPRGDADAPPDPVSPAPGQNRSRNWPARSRRRQCCCWAGTDVSLQPYTSVKTCHSACYGQHCSVMTRRPISGPAGVCWNPFTMTGAKFNWACSDRLRSVARNDWGMPPENVGGVDKVLECFKMWPQPDIVWLFSRYRWNAFSLICKCIVNELWQYVQTSFSHSIKIIW